MRHRKYLAAAFVVFAWSVLPQHVLAQNQAAAQTGGAEPPPRAVRPVTPEDINRLRGALTQQNSSLILNRSEVGQLRDRSLDSEYSLRRPGYSGKKPPTPRRKELLISQAPDGSVPSRLSLAQGIVSAVTILDQKGNPWPIEDLAYDPQMLSVNGIGCSSAEKPPQADKEGRPHVLYLMPCRFWTWANLVVKLERSASPLTFQVESGSDEEGATVDMAIDVRVKGAAPSRGSATGLAAASDRQPREAGFRPDSSLDDFLNGTPPPGARELRVSGDPSANAWLFGGALYLKGPLVVMNPAHDARASYGGVSVWRFDHPIPRILARTSDGAQRVVVVDF
ncbi:DotH/IcmK family type IV secretion protein [Microvirga puerhi]|uniref:DotH/IcmK family type IV secretion protein n=1 Tax=Microvirga puerhi TaxID=2876078 RepID=A0ABS7VUZ1_9HYPH|nr:DotH/IcmK family type IV secretion protein [Microvirga puerhi]MBZ6078940.1 DotH/IcmK family type IV secretion protein [Microvirga puerhi]